MGMDEIKQKAEALKQEAKTCQKLFLSAITVAEHEHKNDDDIKPLIAIKEKIKKEEEEIAEKLNQIRKKKQHAFKELAKALDKYLPEDLRAQ